MNTFLNVRVTNQEAVLAVRRNSAVFSVLSKGKQKNEHQYLKLLHKTNKSF